ncbi:unnamed protein product [Rhodiola kirilowii]
MSSKPNRSTLPETPPPKKTSVATPSRISKLSRGLPKTEGDLTSSVNNSSRLSLDRSATRSANSKPSFDKDTPPKSVAAKTLVDRRSPRLTTPPEKIHAAKESENQVKLNDLQEDLKKAKEQLALLENEKAAAVSELKEAKRIADAANEKLSEALVAQKRAEEDSEIEKFRALEIEQVGTEITQKKEEEWMKEIETIRSQHTIDVEALLSTTLELQRLKEELSMTSDAKNQALCHADDATKIAEVHAEKAEMLSVEVNRLKALLDSKVEAEAHVDMMVTELKSEVAFFKQELEKTVILKEKIAEQDETLEQINVDLEAARMAEAYAYSLVKECNDRIQILIEEASQSERRASEALATVTKQLEDKGSLLQDSESNISILKEKMSLLEISLEKQEKDLEESERRTVASNGENFRLSQTVESLTSELQTVREEKLQALSNEMLAASNIEKLLEEKSRLTRDLEVLKDEDEKSKKAMETLAEALHEVSSEAREAKENLQATQAEKKNLENQIEDLNNTMKATNENHESMLDDAKHEISVFMKKLEQSNNVFEISKAEWVQKEDQFAESLKRLENEKLSADTEIQRLEISLKEAEGEALAKKEEAARLGDSLKEAKSEVISLHEFLGEAKADSSRLEETLMDKEAELKMVIQENKELQNQKAAYLRKIEELSKSLQEANAKKMTEEDNDLTDSDKDYDLLPKVVEFSVENGNANGKEAAIKVDLPSPKPQECTKIEKTHVNNDYLPENSPIQSDSADHNEDLHVNYDKEKADLTEGRFMMWESCKIDEKDYSPSRETEHESFDEEADSKVEGGSDSFDQSGENPDSVDSGSTSPSKQPKKKKKPLLSKFGSLLKKKSSPGIQK